MTEAIVILWWGAELRLLGQGPGVASRTVESGRDPVAAILRFAADEQPAARSARIVYHPDTLETHLTACPRAGRWRLRRALARQFPALRESDTAWSAWPRRSESGGWAAVLHLERETALPRLSAALARRGVRVEGAWPILSVFDSLAPCAVGERGCVGLVAAGCAALVSTLDPAGDRLLQVRAGPGFAAAAGADLASAMARFDEGDPPPVVAVIEEGPSADGFRQALPARPRLSEISWSDFLGQARTLPPGRSGDFLAPAPFWRRRTARSRIALAAGVLLLVGGAGAVLAAARDRERRRRQAASDQIERARAHEFVESQLVRRAEIDRLARSLGSMAGPPGHHFEWLMALSRATPKGIVLRSVATAGDAFTVRGHICDGAGRPEGPLAAFDHAMASAGQPWSWLGPETTADPAADPDFVRRGTLLSDAPAPAPDGATPENLAGLDAQVAAARARLRSAREFAAWLEAWDRRWSVQASSDEPAGDLEIRHCTLAYREPTLNAWSDIVQSLQVLDAEPGLTIDSLILTAAPDGVDAFAQAQLTLTIRLRG